MVSFVLPRYQLFERVYQTPRIVIKTTLKNLFKHYGPVLDVVAHRNIRMRGQAFVSFDSVETAYKALKEVKGFPLYAKPMVGITPQFIL